MKVPHLVRVGDGPAAFAPLSAALAAAGLRLGWLEWTPPAPLPVGLTAAAELGALRAVAVGGGMTAAVRPLAGPPVLADLVRGHFLGCALVLVRGDHPATARLPRLDPEANGYRLVAAGGERRYGDPAALAARLRSPRPLATGNGSGDGVGAAEGSAGAPGAGVTEDAAGVPSATKATDPPDPSGSR